MKNPDFKIYKQSSKWTINMPCFCVMALNRPLLTRVLGHEKCLKFYEKFTSIRKVSELLTVKNPDFQVD